MLTRERLQEVVDDAVERGRMTRDDATDARRRDVRARPPQTEDLIDQLEGIVTGTPTRIVREVDRARRATGIGSTFPISGYEDLTAAQVGERLGDLSAAGAAQGARLRAPQREPQDGAAERSSASSASEPPAILGAMAAPTTLARPRRGDELELTVDRLAYGGNGVARRDDGFVVFVAGAVPGDRVRAEIGKSKKAYAEARTVELLEPSPDRIPAVADHPGAPWQVLPYARQLEVKQEQVEDALTRIGRLEGYELEPIVPAIEEWRYRNKLEYSFGTGEDG